MESEAAIKFINLVEAQPMLYNKRSGSYKRADLKAKKWHEIALAMNFPNDETAIKKWKYLRDKYVKIKREGKYRPTGTGAEDDDLCEWPLYPYMDFLSEYVQQRRHYSNLSVSGTTEATLAALEESETMETQGFNESNEEEDQDTYDGQSASESSAMSPSTYWALPETPITPIPFQSVGGSSGAGNQENVRSATLSTCRSSMASTVRVATPSTSRSTTPCSSRSATPSTSRSTTPNTSRSTTPGTSRGATPGTSRRTSPERNKSSAVDDALLNLGAYFANKSPNNADAVFGAYVASELQTMPKARKAQLKKMILNFLATVDESE